MTTNEIADGVQQAYAQAKKFGEELSDLYKREKARRQEVENTTQKLQAIFDTAPNAFAVVDNELNLIEANPRFLMLFETDPACLGKSLSIFLPTENLTEIMQTRETLSVGLGRVELEMTGPVPRTILVTLAPLNNDQGWVLILHDLTERKRLEGLKEEFINIAAHELRTPLAGVIGFVGVLQEELKDSDNPMAENLMDLILQSTHRLKVIIDELVSFAATRRDPNESLHIANIDLNWLITKTIKFLQEPIEAKNLTYHLDLPSIPLSIQGDSFILSEVLYQLIKNAATFNKENGSITVRIYRCPLSDFSQTDQQLTDNASNELVTCIEIEDTGIGIPKTDLDHIFERFYQVEEHLTRGVGGLGLGLTIARYGIHRHGGTLTVSSELGKGSHFLVRLPSITELTDVSIDNRMDVAYQQTMIYAKEIARAIASQRKTSKKMGKVHTLSSQLDDKLQTLSQLTPDNSEYEDILNQVKNLSHNILILSDVEVLV
jgi:two-component system phosphate regulon sensor histidine kinase PhoR